MYNSPDIIQLTTLRRTEWVVQSEHVGERNGAYTVLVGKPVIKRLLGISKFKWKDNIKMDFQDMGLVT
jgi:hypothetical protein